MNPMMQTAYGQAPTVGAGFQYGANDLMARIAQQLASSGGDATGVARGLIQSGVPLERTLSALSEVNGGQFDANMGNVAQQYRNAYGAAQTQLDAQRPQGGGGGGGTGLANPYLPDIAGDIQRRVNYSRDLGLQAIRSRAVGVGGMGGTRQGVAEAGAIAGSADNLAGQLANLYGGAWDSDRNRSLTARSQDMNFYQGQRAQDLQQLGLAGDLYSQGTQGNWSGLRNGSDILSRYTGFGSETSGGQQGGGFGGAVGGALAGASLAGRMGLWGNSGGGGGNSRSAGWW